MSAKKPAEPKLPYPSLKDNKELSDQLLSIVAALKKSADGKDGMAAASEMSKTQQTRKSARDNFTFALLLGVAEAKAMGKIVAKLDLTKEGSMLWDKATKLCSDISQQIESGMWVLYDSQLSKEYSRKFRQLQASLRHDENHELRMRLISGQVEPLSVTSLRPDQLAPKQRQEQMEFQMKQYFDSKVKISNEDDAAAGSMIMKTDQGLEFVTASKKSHKTATSDANDDN